MIFWSLKKAQGANEYEQEEREQQHLTITRVTIILQFLSMIQMSLDNA